MPDIPAFDFREFTFQVVRHQQAIADKLGVNLTDFKCLGLLHRKGPQTPKQLAEAVGVSGAAMTTVIDRLEKAGFAKRMRRTADRRSLTVHAGAESERKVSALYRSLQTRTSRLNASYSQKELDLIGGYLKKSTEVLQQASTALLK
jgi:DNA-binding MarR family transcriptional regulator